MSKDNPPPKELMDSLSDLLAHADEFDAFVCGFDLHGTVLGTLAAALLDKPLLIVCAQHGGCSISHIQSIGVVTPEMRFCYIDDYDEFGATKDTVFKYMCQSATPNIVACYMATKKQFTRGRFKKVGFKREMKWVSR